MTQEKDGPDATPRIGLDLGRQIFDGSSRTDPQQGQAGTREDRIRQRAYELWESEGRSGDPHDHWYRAERELNATAQGSSEATVENAPPAAAAEALDAVSDQPAAEGIIQKRTRSKRTA